VISPARLVAFEVLLRVEDGAFAGDLLMDRAAKLSSRDAGLASEIVFGSLRRQAQLDFLIERVAGKKKLDREVRIALRMGIYQIAFLERIPKHAAVHESVELVKKARKASAAGLVNAVLRKTTPELPAWPDRSTSFSVPEWLLVKWDRQFGPETADRIAEAFLQKPETFVRVTAPELPQVEGLELEPTEVPGCYRVVQGLSALRSTEECEHLVPGLRVMDIGSQSIVPLLDLQPGMTFLDLCAAPGNKTAQAVEAGVRAVACDLHWHRARSLRSCPAVVLDAREPLPFRNRFDRVLVDAPCSGTGTLGRNPEIRWRIAKEDLVDLHRRQVAILGRGLDALAPGGILVYSTCSLEAEENEEVVSEVVASRKDVELTSTRYRIPGRDPGDGFFAAVLTSRLAAND
jgi:16S rRNA (cytosine967-C5)-methyltransferase